jgi:hypothetical protein
MIDGQQIIGFTPVGRKRYMDILVPYIIREHERGHIDRWVLFNNAYLRDDSTLCTQIANQLPWCEVIDEVQTGGVNDSEFKKFVWHPPTHICGIYDFLRAGEGAIYVRLDDDLCYIDENAIERLVRYRLANPEPFIVYPTIINNVRTSYHLQQAGLIPMEWGQIENSMTDIVAHRNSDFVFNLHQKTLTAIEGGTLVEEFALPSENFTDWERGHISINCFAIFGRDLPLTVPGDEEGYLSLHRPQELNRPNARCGDAVVAHYAFHRQALYMDLTGLLGDYARIAPPMPFRLVPVAPDFMTEGEVDTIKKG